MTHPDTPVALVDPEQFGCSGKAAMKLTNQLSRTAETDNIVDFSKFPNDPSIISSIDRINRCSRNWNDFARIAINHAINDIRVAGARPIQAMACFNFASDTDDSEKMKGAHEFFVEFRRRNIELGKCHTSINNEIDSVIISIIGVIEEIRQNVDNSEKSDVQSGYVYLSRKLGHFKLHYMREMGIGPEIPCQTDALTADWLGAVNYQDWLRLSDISGHGIAAALTGLARSMKAQIDVTLSRELAAHPCVLDAPMPCFLNWIGDYRDEGFQCQEEAWPLAGLMETSGPIVGLSKKPLIDEAIRIGAFKLGPPSVNITWLS